MTTLTAQQAVAYQLYLEGRVTQKAIAEKVGVSARTINQWIRQFSWQRLKEAAMAAPALIAEKISSQVIELLDSISAREEGKRFPTIQEAEIVRKYTNCLDKYKKYPTLAQSMQAVRGLLHFIDQRDYVLGNKVQIEYEEYFKQQACNGFQPFEMEYGVDPMAFTYFNAEEVSEESDNKITADYDSTPRPFIHKAFTKVEPEVDPENIVETIDDTEFELPAIELPLPEESGSKQGTCPHFERTENPTTNDSITSKNDSTARYQTWEDYKKEMQSDDGLSRFS